jgi:hypothetical protein
MGRGELSPSVRANAQDVHDGPISVTWRSIGFPLALELSDHEQEIARFDVADPFASDQGVDVVLEPTEVSIGVAPNGKLCPVSIIEKANAADTISHWFFTGISLGPLGTASSWNPRDAMSP